MKKNKYKQVGKEKSLKLVSIRQQEQKTTTLRRAWLNLLYFVVVFYLMK